MSLMEEVLLAETFALPQTTFVTPTPWDWYQTIGCPFGKSIRDFKKWQKRKTTLSLKMVNGKIKVKIEPEMGIARVRVSFC